MGGEEFESGCMGKLRQRPLQQAVGQGTWWGSTTLHHHQVLSAANVPDRTPDPFQQARAPLWADYRPRGLNSSPAVYYYLHVYLLLLIGGHFIVLSHMV